MVKSTTITATAFALLAAIPVEAGLYAKGSPVLQVDGKNYDRLIAQSNYTSIVEFYAPWCGHCKNLQPAYEKAAKSLAGLGKVAAVNCDDDENKPFCGQFGIQGFPTLKIVKPGAKSGRPVVEEYQGARTAKGIVEAVTDKMPNLVKRVGDKDLEGFLAGETPKAVLFSDKGKTSALLKAVAIEFKGGMTVAQIRNTEKASVELFGITKYPTLIMLPGGKDTEKEVYDGEMTKEGIVNFLSKLATPNPDPAPPKVKLPKASKGKKAASKSKEAFESASASHAKSEKPVTATDETLEEEATESPSPEVDAQKPVLLPDPAPRIPTLSTEGELREACLGPKIGTCILALTSSELDTQSGAVITALSEIAHKYRIHDRPIFPFYVLPSENEGSALLTSKLNLKENTEIIAMNGRRGWWRHISTSDYFVQDNDEATQEKLSNWIDTIRLGDGAKTDIPKGLIPEIEEEEEQEGKPAPDDTKEEVPEPEAAEEPKTENTAESEMNEDVPEPEVPEEPRVENTMDEDSKGTGERRHGEL